MCFTSQPLLDELLGEPVEQLRMRRQRALDAEVVQRFDDPLAEADLPHPIHEDAGRQRVVRRDDPVRPDRAESPVCRCCQERRGSRVRRAARFRPSRRASCRVPPGRAPRAASGPEVETKVVGLAAFISAVAASSLCRSQFLAAATPTPAQSCDSGWRARSSLLLRGPLGRLDSEGIGDWLEQLRLVGPWPSLPTSPVRHPVRASASPCRP